MPHSDKVILHCLESFGGGTAKVVQALIAHIPQAKHIVVHGARADEIHPMQLRAEFHGHVEFIHWRFTRRELNPIFDLLSLVHLWYIFVSHRVTAIHLHSSKAGFLGRVAALLSGQRRVIYTAHAAAFLREDVSQTKKRLFSALEKIAGWLPGTVVACSNSEKKAFENIGVRAICIPNGVAITEFEKKRKDSPLPVTIINSGRLTAQKNPRLFNEIAQYFSANPLIKFVWIGEGELAHQLTAPNIHLTGWQTRSQVLEHLRQADIYVGTSLWEGLSIAILEAMDSCLPLVLHHCTGNADLVEEGYNGFLFNHFGQAINALERLIHDAELRWQLGQNSKNLAKSRFNLDTCIQDYKKLYGI